MQRGSRCIWIWHSMPYFYWKLKAELYARCYFRCDKTPGGVQMDVRHLFPPKKRYHYVQEVWMLTSKYGCMLHKACECTYFSTWSLISFHSLQGTKGSRIYQLNISISRYWPCCLLSTYPQIRWQSSTPVGDVYLLCLINSALHSLSNRSFPLTAAITFSTAPAMRDVHVWFVFKENWQKMTASEAAILQKRIFFMW